MNEYEFFSTDTEWEQWCKADPTGFWILAKHRRGALGESDGRFGPVRDALEVASNYEYPSSTAHLPYNWWIICAGTKES